MCVCAHACAQMHVPTREHAHVRVVFRVGESGDLAERGQMLKMLSHYVLARDTWPKLAKLLRNQPQPKCWEPTASQAAYDK